MVEAGETVRTWSDEQARSILDVLRAVSIHRDREQLFRAITQTLRAVLPCHAFAINLDGPGPDEMTPWFVEPRVAMPLLKRSESALEQVLVTGEPLYVRSRADLAGRPGSLRALERLGAHSYLALPLATQGRVFAALVLHAPEPHAYDAVDLGFAREVATAIGIAVDHCIAYETIARSRDRLVAENTMLRSDLRAAHDPNGVIAESGAMREVLRLLELVAPTDATVLLTGETGAGKERLARMVHERSARADRPLIAINCAAIPAGLIESELFGHEQGAFTGAGRRRRGRFELADRGTLFLDEIGELPLDFQAKLLRVLQTQELERVGGSETIRTDVRLIAATNRDLPAAIGAGTFRSDLYYRIAVFPLEVPPLWARRDDIAPLARHFVAESARRLGRTPPHVDGETVEVLQAYSWPGNVRELENVIERAVILSRGGILDVAPLLDVEAPAPPTAPAPEPSEADDLRRVLEAARWVIEGDGGAASRLGVRPSTLRSRMRRLGIERP